MDRGRRCIVIGVGINIASARLVLINADVNDDYVMLVSVSSDAINTLVEFTRHVYQDLNVEVKSITVNTQVSLVDAVSTLRSMIEANAPCSVTIGIAGDRWVTTILSFLVMVLATVGVLLMLALIGSSSCLAIKVSLLTGLLCLGSLT